LLVNLRCQIAHLTQHILNENAVSRGGVIDEHVGHHTTLRSVASLLRKHCAPTSLPFLMMDEPDTSVVKYGKKF